MCVCVFAGVLNITLVMGVIVVIISLFNYTEPALPPLSCACTPQSPNMCAANIIICLICTRAVYMPACCVHCTGQNLPANCTPGRFQVWSRRVLRCRRGLDRPGGRPEGGPAGRRWGRGRTRYLIHNFSPLGSKNPLLNLIVQQQVLPKNVLD